MTPDTYPPEDGEKLTLVLRGDNVIYYRNKPEAKVKYRGSRAGIKRWNAVCLNGPRRGWVTPDCTDKREVLMHVWNHDWLEPIF